MLVWMLKWRKHRRVKNITYFTGSRKDSDERSGYETWDTRGRKSLWNQLVRGDGHDIKIEEVTCQRIGMCKSVQV